MQCPRDGATLDTKTYEANVQIDACPSCRGMWLDKGELEAIQEAREHDHAAQLDKLSDTVAASIEVTRQESRAAIQCPRCDAELDTREYGYCSQIMVDVCPEGCGMWLDEGEIQALEAFFEKAADSAQLPIRWRLWASLVSLFKR